MYDMFRTGTWKWKIENLICPNCHSNSSDKLAYFYFDRNWHRTLVCLIKHHYNNSLNIEIILHFIYIYGVKRHVRIAYSSIPDNFFVLEKYRSYITYIGLLLYGIRRRLWRAADGRRLHKILLKNIQSFLSARKTCIDGNVYAIT